MQEVATTVFRLLVYPGNTNFKNSHPPSERAVGYIGFHCINVSVQYGVSVCKCPQIIFFFLIHPSRHARVQFQIFV